MSRVPLDFAPSNPKELEMCLNDPWWRLCSGQLYKILVKTEGEDSDGLIMPFKPNKAQRKLLKRMHFRNVILKARQLGFTTLIAIFFLDCCLFRANVRAGIVAQDLKAAETIFRDKVRFAYDNLPDHLRAAMPLKSANTSEMLFHNNSSIRVAVSMRSGTLQYLHVSEFGKICAKFPQRAEEVMTGSIPALAPGGLLFIESTAEGQTGHFYDITTRAMKLHQSGKKLGAKDYSFHFFPWWDALEYRLDPDDVIITADDDAYFDKIEAQMGCVIDIEQRAWWVATRDQEFSGSEEKMWQEYPSTPEEAFQKSTKGCYYTVQMVAARKAKRITTVPHVDGYPVNTFWDIGNSDGTAIWFHQQIGQQHRFIKFIEGWGEPYAHFVSEMQKLGWVWGTHYLPHDGNHARQGENQNLTPREMLENLGLKNIEIVERVSELQHGIQKVRDVFGQCWFDETECKAGLIHLESYKKKWNAQTENFTDVPVKHDGHSEAADAFRQFAQGYTQPSVRAGQRPRRRNKSGAVV